MTRHGGLVVFGLVVFELAGGAVVVGCGGAVVVGATVEDVTGPVVVVVAFCVIDVDVVDDDVDELGAAEGSVTAGALVGGVSES